MNSGAGWIRHAHLKYRKHGSMQGDMNCSSADCQPTSVESLGGPAAVPATLQNPNLPWTIAIGCRIKLQDRDGLHRSNLAQSLWVVAGNGTRSYVRYITSLKLKVPQSHKCMCYKPYTFQQTFSLNRLLLFQNKRSSRLTRTRIGAEA